METIQRRSQHRRTPHNAMANGSGKCRLDPGSDGITSANESARIVTLGLALLSDSRKWMAAQPSGFPALPDEAFAFVSAAISPWRAPADIAHSLRTVLWVTAFDDYVESLTDLAQVEDTLQRCADIVCDNRDDDDHWLYASLSSLQRGLMAQPLYPTLAGLWAEKFTSMLHSQRYEWTAARSTHRNQSDVEQYLANAANVASEVVHLPRWITYGDDAVLDHLDDLVPALGDEVIAIRLANDLATFARECDLPSGDNILMYGVSPEWVESEIARRVDAVHKRLAPLVAAHSLPAAELVRETDAVVTFYSIQDCRGWGSDAS